MHDPAGVRKSVCGVVLLAIAGPLLVAAPATAAKGPRTKFPQVVSVAETFNNTPFDYRIESRTEKPAFTVYRLTYPSPVVTPVVQNNTVPAEYYVPKGMKPGDAKRPAVICLHILEGNFELVHMTCSMLASRGVPAMMFKLPYYGERALPGGPRALADDPALFAGALSQAMEDVRRTVDVLASRPEVDSKHLGITGISLGAIVAASAAGNDPRLSRAALILGGGDLNHIIHYAQETQDLSELIHGLPPQRRREIKEAIDAVDPLRRAERLRDRATQGKVLMVNATDDRVIPPSCTKKLAAALGISDRVIWLDGLGHYTAMAELPRVLRITAEFFAEDLPPGVKPAPPTVAGQSPLEVVIALVQQVAAVLTIEPQPDRCHFADLQVAVTPEGEETIEGRLRYIRGTQGKFSIQCHAPIVGDVALGQGRYPWLVSGGKSVFKGTGNPSSQLGSPLAFVKDEHLVKIRVVAGAAAGLTLVPELLEQVAAVADDTPAEGPRTLRIDLKGKLHGSLRLVLKDDGKTPEVIRFDVEGVAGTVTFHGWQVDTLAHPSMFDPPQGLAEREVDRADLVRIFSAMFNFALENAQ